MPEPLCEYCERRLSECICVDEPQTPTKEPPLEQCRVRMGASTATGYMECGRKLPCPLHPARAAERSQEGGPAKFTPEAPGGGAAPEAEKLAAVVVDAWEAAEHESMREGHRATMERMIARALEATRAAALEEAEKECEAVASEARESYDKRRKAGEDTSGPTMRFIGGMEVGADDAAERVRALANPEDKGSDAT